MSRKKNDHWLTVERTDKNNKLEIQKENHVFSYSIPAYKENVITEGVQKSLISDTEPSFAFIFSTKMRKTLHPQVLFLEKEKVMNQLVWMC